MKRRTLLAGLATGAVGLAGCFGEGDGSGDGTGGGNETAGGGGSSDGDDSDGNVDDGDSGGDDGDSGGNGGGDTGSGGDDGSTAPPTIDDSEIATTGRNCGSTDAGEASAERADGAVTVDGVIVASNPCHEAALVDVAIHNRQLVLRVDVENAGEGACQTCIGEISYTATVRVSDVGGLHGVTVEHAGGDEYVTNWEESDDASP